MEKLYRFTVVLPENYKYKIKMVSAKANKSIKEIVKEAIDKYMESQKDKD